MCEVDLNNKYLFGDAKDSDEEAGSDRSDWSPETDVSTWCKSLAQASIEITLK